MPSRGLGDVGVNPFWSQKTQDEFRLAASRPGDLPNVLDTSDSREPIQSVASGLAVPPSFTDLTGKGRGGISAGVPSIALERPTVVTRTPARTEGEMPGETVAGKRSMGPVGHVRDPDQGSGSKSDDLQKMLEAEIVNFLRDQNSMLLQQVEELKGKLEKSTGLASVGGETSPWSAVGGMSNEKSNGVGSSVVRERHARHGSRHGSRTPRARMREAAVSPECGRRDPAKYTPNGTRVPDGPPPVECDQPVPPVPPIPGLEEALKFGEGHQSSFVSEIHGLDIYDTCESKPKMKGGNTAWKPLDEREGVLTASEAKQFWMEKEIHSLKLALDRVSVPQVLQQSDYWNGNFQSGFPTVGRIPPAVAACMAHEREGGNLRGGSGVAPLPDRAALGGCGDHGLQARACAMLSESHDGVRASQLQALGEHLDQARAQRTSRPSSGSAVA